MPVAKPPLPAECPAPLDPADLTFIKDTVRQFFGTDAVVRNYGPDPSRLMLHVEIGREPEMEEYDCAGALMARLDREQISVIAMRRGTRPRGEDKIALRQGVVL